MSLTKLDPLTADQVPQAPSGRILIVDDEPDVREILSRWLEREGYQCATAADAQEACEQLKDGNFALLVTDIMMPGISGIDLLSTVKQKFPDVAVLMATAVDNRKTAIQALEIGAYGYVVKPFERNEVAINVVSALERRRLVLASQQYEQRLEERVREQTEDIRRSREEILLRLIAAQEFRHDETGAHVRRIGLYSEVLASRMGRPADYAETLRLASPMHDVGKIGIPDAILQKPGKLDDNEREIMKTHTTIGARILKGTHIPLLHTAEQIAIAHHEKWDGSGYPKGLAGEDIPESARIVAVLDVYDALVNDRVYRPAVPEHDALAIMDRGRSSHFDPDIYDAFRAALPELRVIRSRLRDKPH